MKTFSCHKISEGIAEGEVLISEDDFCFYLVDPKTGIVIEPQHCLYGKSIAGKILVFPNGKGSSVVQADGMYQLKMSGMEPKGMIIKNPDTTLVASAIIMETPLVDKADEAFYKKIKDGSRVELNATEGTITLEEAEKTNPLIWIIDEEWSDYELEKKLLKTYYPECEIRYSSYDYQKDLEEFGYRADMILAQVYTYIPAEVISKLESCKGIAIYGGGYDRVDIAAAKAKGIKVTNVQGYCAEDIADYVAAAVYHHNKKLCSFEAAIENGKWGALAVTELMPRVSHSTIFFAGCGTIGRAAAQKVKALGMRVIGYDPAVSDETLKALGIEPVSFEEGFKQADYVSVHIKYTPQTEGIIGRKQFELMKPTAVLINTSRGRVLVEEELVEAVEKGTIAGAIVDVIANEPPAGDEKILSCKGILVTPHISYISQDSFDTLKRRTVENACTMFRGGRPQDWVNA